MERKEPKLGNMVPSRDDGMSRRSGASSNASPAQPSAPAPRKSPEQPSAPTGKNSGSPLVPVALVVALIGVAIGAFAFWQLQEVQTQFEGANQRLSELEQQLALTGDESTQSMTTLQANLKKTNKELEVANHEIRKLWDTRNVNRKGIADNKSSISEAKTSLDKVAKAQKESQASMKSQMAQISSATSELALYSEKLNLATDMNEAQQKQLRQLVDQINQHSASLKKLQGELTKRVAGNEEAIKAIDGFRLSTNRELTEIKRNLRALSTGTSPQ